MEPPVRLDASEARVLGVLVEKATTTPDQYPLSLNALTAGCNQKSNRDPVTSLGQGEVMDALHKLRMQQLVGFVRQAGARVEKYRHTAEDRLEIGPPQLAILAELLVRGPQTPGDLRGRAARMAPLPTQAELAAALAPLLERGFVAEAAPAPGSRAARYRQRLAPELHGADAAPLERPSAEPAPRPATPAAATSPVETRLDALEGELARLRATVEELARRLGAPTD